jgi:trehalose-6-phosphate synthase
MKLNLALVLSIIVAVGIVAYVFSAFQISTERERLTMELEIKTLELVEDFYTAHLADFDKGGILKDNKVNDSILSLYSFAGVAIYYNNDSIRPLNDDARQFVKESNDFIQQAMSADSSMGHITEINDTKYFQYVKVIPRQNLPDQSVIFYTSAQYVENIIHSIGLRNFFRWFLQSLLIASLTMLIIRWGILTPLNKVIIWIKAARFGNIEQLKKSPPPEFLQPLYKEISGMADAMAEAKAIAQEEAKLRTSGEAVWTPERLNEEMKLVLDNRLMVVVSNREPYMHVRSGKEIQCIVPASGMVTAMEPVLKSTGGLWIASGSGDADRETVDEHDKVLVPPFEDRYTLRRIWLTKEQEDKYYYGFSNEGLWPLCHIAHTRPVFRYEDWQAYCEVNKIYADAVIKEIKNKEEPFILVQDYHFALLPQLIKKERPDAKVAIFWHIPWPNPESFNICPWQKEILQGMLGADLVGFHTQYHCNNFLETINNSLESRVIWESFTVKMGKQMTLVKPFPISIAFTLKDFEADSLDKPDASAMLKEHGINGMLMGIGVDRIDYTKGLIEKFLAIERFLEKYPEYQNVFTFVQIAAPSRALLKSYADTISAVEKEVDRINWRFKSKNWQPILYLKGHHSHEQIIPFYEAANFCMVTSLHDGMNLVAKEFIAARKQNDGALILSRFAGASQEFHNSILINPYDVEQSAEAIKYALEMPRDEQIRKMKQMRRRVMSHNVYSWAAAILKTMASIES